MMMAALYAGAKGLDLLVAPILEEANLELDGYQPNPNGLYEVGLVRYLEARFARKIPDDALIKILFDGLPTLPKGDYKIIFMTRDEAEIVASIDKVEAHFEACEDEFLKRNPDGKPRQDHNEHTQLLPFCSLRPYNREDVQHILGICEARTDFDVMCIDYAEVIETPLETFTRLQDLGWPIDPEKCASTIDKSLYRVRKTA
jgi:hypothetical protein